MESIERIISIGRRCASPLWIAHREDFLQIAHLMSLGDLGGANTLTTAWRHWCQAYGYRLQRAWISPDKERWTAYPYITARGSSRKRAYRVIGRCVVEGCGRPAIRRIDGQPVCNGCRNRLSRTGLSPADITKKWRNRTMIDRENHPHCVYLVHVFSGGHGDPSSQQIATFTLRWTGGKRNALRRCNKLFPLWRGIFKKVRHYGEIGEVAEFCNLYGVHVPGRDSVSCIKHPANSSEDIHDAKPGYPESLALALSQARAIIAQWEDAQHEHDIAEAHAEA